jgi:DNA-binding XRE family transcriptional regulator
MLPAIHSRVARRILQAVWLECLFGLAAYRQRSDQARSYFILIGMPLCLSILMESLYVPHREHNAMGRKKPSRTAQSPPSQGMTAVELARQAAGTFDRTKQAPDVPETGNPADLLKGLGSGTEVLIASPKDLARAVRAVRRAGGFSQRGFADLAGVGWRTLTAFENGEETTKLAKVLKITASAGIDLFATKR